MPHSPTHFQQTEEQRNAAFQAAGVNQPITGDTLTDTPNLDFQLEQDVPDGDISGLSTDLPEVETPFTDKSDDFIADFLANQDALAGKSAFESGVREDVGLSGLRTTQEDLVGQIQGFQLQSKNLANQFNLASSRIQQESEGRGRTISGIAPLTAAAQRRIALQQADIASQALTASATLAATRGQLSTAQRLVQEAVDKRFGPLKAEKVAIIQNLELLINSGVNLASLDGPTDFESPGCCIILSIRSILPCNNSPVISDAPTGSLLCKLLNFSNSNFCNFNACEVLNCLASSLNLSRDRLNVASCKSR